MRGWRDYSCQPLPNPGGPERLVQVYKYMGRPINPKALGELEPINKLLARDEEFSGGGIHPNRCSFPSLTVNGRPRLVRRRRCNSTDPRSTSRTGESSPRTIYLPKAARLSFPQIRGIFEQAWTPSFGRRAHMSEISTILAKCQTNAQN